MSILCRADTIHEGTLFTLTMEYQQTFIIEILISEKCHIPENLLDLRSPRSVLISFKDEILGFIVETATGIHTAKNNPESY